VAGFQTAHRLWPVFKCPRLAAFECPPEAYFYLYAVIDIYSRYIVGWMVADRESSELARVLLKTTVEEQGADPTKLTVHADRGSSMTSKPVAFMLADLGVTKSQSRPHVSNDNPQIESFFKTAKYQPEFPATFPNIATARAFCRAFMGWYTTSTDIAASRS
jgi:putative transposase